MTETHAAVYSVLSAIRDERFDDIGDEFHTLIYHAELRAILRTVHDAREENPCADLLFITDRLPGGLKRFNAVISAEENSARQEMGARPEDDPRIPLVRALDVLRTEAHRRRRGAILGQLAEAHRKDDREAVARITGELSALLDEQGTEQPDFFHSRADFPNGFPAPEYLVNGIIPAESLGFIAGAPKTGRKTTLATALAVAVAGGGLWLGRECSGGDVLYLAAEEPDAAIYERIRKTINGLELPTDAETRIWSNLRWGCGPRWTLDSSEGQAELSRAVKKHAPALLILDPLTRLFVGDENDRGAVEPVLSYLKALVLRHHLAVCIVHHAGKGAALAPTPESMLRGSSALRGAHDFLVCSSPLDSGGNILNFELRYGEPFRIVANVIHSELTDSIEITTEQPEPQVKGGDGVDLVFTVLDLLERSPVGMTTRAIGQAIHRGNGTTKKLLESLERSGRIRSARGRVNRADGKAYTADIWKTSQDIENVQKTIGY